MSDWKKVESGNTWNYLEEGDNSEFEGIYVSKEENVGENNSIVYTLQKDGNMVTVWGSTVLDIRMKSVQIGEEVKMVYKGKKPSEKRKGKFYNDFDVYHRVTPMEKVSDGDNSSPLD